MNVWDDVTYLLGIPIICEWDEVQHDLANGCSTQANGQYKYNIQLDMTANIIQRLLLERICD